LTPSSWAVERYFGDPRQQAQLNALRRLVAELMPRERQVFELVVQGRQNKQIG
jgi:FixJ family two-component response regulator